MFGWGARQGHDSKLVGAKLQSLLESCRKGNLNVDTSVSSLEKYQRLAVEVSGN